MIELAGIVILGILAQWFAWKLKIPAILPLILIGLIVGPISASYFSHDGLKWIEPIWNGQKGLFPGDSLYYFVSLAISIILFEGGLTLKISEVKQISNVITRLITLGAVVTFFGAGLVTYYLFGLSLEISFLFASLIIVTGPTVITPILRNIPLKKNVSAILKWEGILIDPIGALVAVLVFEFISVEGDFGFTQTAFLEFFKILLFGTTLGFSFAHGLAFAVNKKLIPHYLLNVVSLSTVLFVFVLSDSVAHESGLLAVVIMGMVLANVELNNIKELLYFKESLTVLLISILFILLAANIDMKDLMLLLDTKVLILFLTIIFIIRPLSVWISSLKSSLNYREILFIGWVGPRGIVAAGIASLFGNKLTQMGIEGAHYITPLVFMVVLGTVLLNATTARMFAKLVGVFLKDSSGIIIFGASRFSRLIAQYLMKNGRDVVLVDGSKTNIEKANLEGLKAINTDLYGDNLADDIELNNIGYLFALTSNTKVNQDAILKYKDDFGENGAFRLGAVDELEQPTERYFCHLDYAKIREVLVETEVISETKLKSIEHLNDVLEQMNQSKAHLPLLIKNKNGDFDVLHKKDKSPFSEGSVLVHLGNPIK